MKVRFVVFYLIANSFWLLPATCLAAGSTPSDPIPWNVEGGSIPLSFASSSSKIWLRVAPRSTMQATHFELQTTGNLDTRLYVYANLADAIADRPLAEDDDSGSVLNAYLKVPIGFLGPYLVKASAWSGGSSYLAGNLTLGATAQRCNWPSGCTLATAAQGQPTGASTLSILRAVRDEILSATPRGKELTNLYWRIGTDLVPALVVDSSFRAEIYARVTDLIPLAEAALAVSRGQEAQRTFTQSDVRKLQALQALANPHLSVENETALASIWHALALEAQVDSSLDEVLRSAELIAENSKPTRLLVKLRAQPQVKVGSTKTGISDFDRIMALQHVGALERVHFDIPQNRAAGLTTTLAVELRSPAEADLLLAELKKSPDVEWAEREGIVRALASTQDPWAGQLWGLDAIRAQLAWPISSGSCSVPVAVIDTGLRADLLDFSGRILPGRGYDFAEDDADPTDLHGHGTHVAGTIAANANNLTSIAGVAPNVCFFAIKVLDDSGSGNLEDLAAGIVHAANQGAKVINMSLGCSPADCQSNTVDEALAYAAARDVVIVAAAGNDGTDEISYPASSPWALAVGAVDSNSNLADFSNHGNGLDLVAPGVDIVSVFRDGESCLGSGTSMATPHVSGVVALLRAAKPSWNRLQIADTLLRSCRDLGPIGTDSNFGSGLVDAVAALGLADPCAGALCLNNRRFAIRVTWRDFQGNTGVGKLAPISSDSSGLFWFFTAQNWEVLVKVLDGCSLNNHFWVFAAATTNVEYALHITDTQTGATRTYTNPLGTSAPAITDTTAFATCSGRASAEEVGLAPDSLLWNSSAPVMSAVEDVGATAFKSATCRDPDVCLNQNRFRVEILWRDFQGRTGNATKVAGGTSADSGLFWFFQASNWEFLVKVLNGCGSNGRYWVFAAGTTNVEYTLRITDTATGQVRDYFNPLGRSAQAITDTAAFATCP